MRSRAQSKSSASQRAAAGATGADGGLVADVLEVGTAEAGRAPRDDVEVDVGRERLAARVDGEDLASSGQVGHRYQHLAVEAARGAAAPGRARRGGSRPRARSRPGPCAKPSSSTSSWLRVWSCSRFMLPPLRAVPTASSSSMKTMAGACLRAVSNSLRMRPAPTPANISTNDDADCEKNAAPDSCATALASSVLPVPGGPYSRMPFGTRAPSFANRSGSFRKSTTSRSSSFASSRPATSSQATPVPASGLTACGFVCGIIATARHMKYSSATSSTIGSQTMSAARSPWRMSISTRTRLPRSGGQPHPPFGDLWPARELLGDGARPLARRRQNVVRPVRQAERHGRHVRYRVWSVPARIVRGLRVPGSVDPAAKIACVHGVRGDAGGGQRPGDVVFRVRQE